MKTPLLLSSLLLLVSCGSSGTLPQSQTTESAISHGPILGRISSDGVGIWARTSRTGSFMVRYGTTPDAMDQLSDTVQTTLDRDNTGWVHITGLKAATKYFYEVVTPEKDSPGIGGSFHTLPTGKTTHDTKHNPDGLFNLRFEFACGNNQGLSGSVLGPSMPTYGTMLDHFHRREVPSRVDFAILNGDFIYEEKRDYSPDQWLEQTGANSLPRTVELAPNLVGVWENYKLYLDRGENLAAWHRVIPSFFTFDDHEILNDVYGSAEVGRRDRRAVFRDIGLKAWYDYLGWSNPIPPTRPILFGRAELEAGSDILIDAEANFTTLNLEETPTLHVHWGTPDAGVNTGVSDSEGGDANSRVYEIVQILDSHRLRLRPEAKASGSASYSIGQLSHFRMRVSNSDFFFLDTRTFRQMHDVSNPSRKGVSMLGRTQKAWLKDEMQSSDAKFFFVISSVNLMIPHVGGASTSGRIPNKDDAWTAFVDEREELIRFWDSLGKPVFVLTGDLHNSFAIKVTDRVWEFASGPHNSINHSAGSEAGRPANGVFESRGRKADIRWSSYILDDVPRDQRARPVYCLVQVNNVFNNPVEEGTERWVAFPRPQVVFQYYDGLSGELLYAESIVSPD